MNIDKMLHWRVVVTAVSCVMVATSLLGIACNQTPNDVTLTEQESLEVADTSSSDGSGIYGYEDSGAKYRYVVPAPENHEFIERIEDHRRNTGAAKIYYVLATLDNLNGEELTSILDLSIVTLEGDTIEYRPAWVIFGGWKSLDSGTKIYNEGVYLYNDAIKFGKALPGAKTEVVLAAEKEAPSIKNVFAIPLPDLLGALQALESGKAENLERALEQGKPIRLEKLN